MCIQPSPKYPACISTISRCFIMHPCSMHHCTSEFQSHHANIHQTFKIYNSSVGHLLNTLFTSPQDPENLYCKRSCIGTCSSIHLLPSIWPFCSQPLMFSINFRSIAKDSYSPPPFSEINRCLIFF